MTSLSVKYLSIPEWLQVFDNPIQRDTEARAKRASKDHLKEYDPTHCRVSAAVLPDGTMYKLDGHTRAYLWGIGKLKAPDELIADIYRVDTYNDVIELYKRFDSSKAVEVAVEKLQGAYRLSEFSPNSSILKKGGVTSAIKLLNTKTFSQPDIYTSLPYWLRSFQIIDRYDLKDLKAFPVAVIAAMLLTVEIYGEDAMRFWVAYDNDEGIKTKVGRDAVQSLRDLIREMRVKGKLSGGMNNMETIEKSISAFERYRANDGYVVSLKRTNCDQYIYSNLMIHYKG